MGNGKGVVWDELVGGFEKLPKLGPHCSCPQILESHADSSEKKKGGLIGVESFSDLHSKLPFYVNGHGFLNRTRLNYMRDPHVHH